jgi:hypothetical protein
MRQAKVKSAIVEHARRATRPQSSTGWRSAWSHRLLLGFIAVAAIAGPARAHSDEQKSGTHWLRKCTSPEANGQIECAIYVRAIVEYDELRGTLLKEARLICPEKGLTIGRSREIVLQYLRTHPQDLKLPFVLLAHQGLAAAFPCAPEPTRTLPGEAAPAK